MQDEIRIFCPYSKVLQEKNHLSKLFSLTNRDELPHLLFQYGKFYGFFHKKLHAQVKTFLFYSWT